MNGKVVVRLALLAIVLAAMLHVAYSASGVNFMWIVFWGFVLGDIILMADAVLIAYLATARRGLLPLLITSTISLAIIVSVFFTSWPMRASFVASREALDVLAQGLRDQQRITIPARAGTLVVERAELRGGTVCLWTQLNKSGPTGFVQSPSPDLPVPAWSRIDLGGGWYFVTED